jgi:hypothetical protein
MIRRIYPEGTGERSPRWRFNRSFPGCRSPAFTAETLRALEPANLSEVDAAMNNAIAEKKLPGGVVWIECNGQSYHKAYGNRSPSRESNRQAKRQFSTSLP